jgi:hypothetical protein
MWLLAALVRRHRKAFTNDHATGRELWIPWFALMHWYLLVGDAVIYWPCSPGFGVLGGPERDGLDKRVCRCCPLFCVIIAVLACVSFFDLRT